MSETTNNKKNISKHILPTSSNLLGLCFVILTFIKVLKLGNESLIDELVAIAIIFFLVSSFFSYRIFFLKTTRNSICCNDLKAITNFKEMATILP